MIKKDAISSGMRKDSVLQSGNVFKLDKKDKEIARILSDEGRLNLLRLSKQVRLSREGTRYRVQRLIDNKVILGFRAIINPPSLGYSHITMVMLSLFGTDDKTENELLADLRKTPEVTDICRLLGRWDIMITVVSKDSFHFNDVFKEIRNKNSNVIKDFEINEILEEFKYEDYSGIIETTETREPQ
jgi:Lrp/AsnC family leucine-responsive transcriptional regulator